MVTFTKCGVTTDATPQKKPQRNSNRRKIKGCTSLFRQISICGFRGGDNFGDGWAKIGSHPGCLDPLPFWQVIPFLRVILLFLDQFEGMSVGILHELWQHSAWKQKLSCRHHLERQRRRIWQHATLAFFPGKFFSIPPAFPSLFRLALFGPHGSVAVPRRVIRRGKQTESEHGCKTERSCTRKRNPEREANQRNATS